MARTILNWSLWILSPFSPFLSPTRLLHKSLIPLTRTTCPGSLLESSGIRSGSLVNNSNCTESTGLWQVATSFVKAGERRERQLLRDGPQTSWGVHTGGRVESGAGLSVSYATPFTRTSEGQRGCGRLFSGRTTLVLFPENHHSWDALWCRRWNSVCCISLQPLGRARLNAASPFPRWWHYSLLKVH